MPTKSAKSSPTKIEDIDLSYQFYQRQVNPLMGTLVGDILVDADGDAEIADAKGLPVPDGGSYFRKGEIKFKLLSLNGKQRRLIEQAEDAISAAQAPLFAVLATAPKSDVLEVAQQLMGAAGGNVAYDVIEQVQSARENQMQQQHLQSKATESATTVSDISRTERAEVQKWTEIRAAVLWGIKTEDLELIRDFPGAYGVSTDVGFMADWLKHTEQLVEQIQNFQKGAVA
jgi:gas vesicle protein